MKTIDMSGFGMMDFMNKSLANDRAILKRQSLFEMRREFKNIVDPKESIPTNLVLKKI
ncbi:hypothetical protein [uncultured Marivirga sp.]|uniref:hypothetical protein n=1 Tax=uncultured Marivirga sp. TaxID=1123707 RepID=UPI0030EDEAA7